MVRKPPLAWQTPGGMMYYLGCHLVYRLQGMPLEILPMNTASGIDGVTSEDYGFTVWKYPQGISFIKTYAAEINGATRRQLVITGTKGTIEIKPMEMSYSGGQQTFASFTTAAMAKSWADCSEKWDTPVYDRYDAMMADFAALVRGEYENPYDYDYEIALHGLLMQCCGVR